MKRLTLLRRIQNIEGSQTARFIAALEARDRLERPVIDPAIGEPARTRAILINSFDHQRHASIFDPAAVP